MCANNPIEFHSDEPIIAYKVMTKCPTNSSFTSKTYIPNLLKSLVAGNEYELGKEYESDQPSRKDMVGVSEMYSRGFHAYANYEEAEAMLSEKRILVKVELSDLAFKGTEHPPYRLYEGDDFIVYVANKCKFLEVVKERI